jgi:hypothetical protein
MSSFKCVNFTHVHRLTYVGEPDIDASAPEAPSVEVPVFSAAEIMKSGASDLAR